MVRRTFMQQISMNTIRDKDNKPILTTESSLAGFLKAVGTPHPDKWYEKIWGLKIAIDGAFANAWCDYAFFVGNKFSHCGVDAFSLFKTEEGWKIFHIADTRRTTGCKVPKRIQRKHNP